MILPIVIIAGGMIALIGCHIPQQSVDQQIHDAADLRHYHRGRGLLVALSAFIAVTAGGAIGPEAGIIALVTELSALVTLRMKQADARALMTKIGLDASLGAIYGSPPAGVVYDSKALEQHKIINLLAATCGLGCFFGVLKLLHVPGLRIHADIVLAWDWRLGVVMMATLMLSGLVAVAYTWADEFSRRLVMRVGRPALVTVVGSVLLAGVLTAWPHLRFSGQHELFEIGAHPATYTACPLVAGALAKLSAVILTVRANWKGGVIFPLMLVSTMIGTAVALWGPGEYYGVCAIVAMGLILTAVTRKPLVVFLVVLFLVPGLSYVPLLMGIGVGTLLYPVTPEPTGH